MKKVIATVLAFALVVGVGSSLVIKHTNQAADIVMYSDPKPGSWFVFKLIN